MSTKKSQNVFLALDRLKEVLNLETDIALADYLGKTQGLLSTWRVRDKIKPGKYEILIEVAEKEGINLHWLFTGEGPMHLDPKKEPQCTREERELIARYQTASPDTQQAVNAVLGISSHGLPLAAEQTARYGPSKKTRNTA